MPVPDEFVIAIAAALATKGMDALAAGGKTAFGALRRLIQNRFGSDTAEAAALAALDDEPDDPSKRAQLEAALASVMEIDPEFAAEVRAGWHAAAMEVSAGHDAVVNQFVGSVDRIVQARDIHGDVKL